MAFLYFFIALLLFIGIGACVLLCRLVRVRRSHRALPSAREQFVAGFRSMDIPEQIPEAVYDYYSSIPAYRKFSFLASDKYSGVLYDDPEDLEVDAERLIAKLRWTIPPAYILREYPGEFVKTLEEMVRWLDFVRMHQQPRHRQPEEQAPKTL